MKGEIFRRMSMEIVKDEDGERDNSRSTMKDLKKVKPEDEDDYLVKSIGAFGAWQAIVCVTVSLTRVVAMWNIISFPFLTPIVDFVCVEFSDNNTEVHNSTCYNNCLKYNYSSVMGRTIIEDFQLICDNAWLASFTQSILMIASIVGVSFFGWISDRFGRRTAILLSTFLNAVFMIALPFSPSYIVFISIRFVIGLASGGALIICIVHAMEIIGKRQRNVAGGCVLIPDGLAQAILAGFAYLTSDWQSFTLSYGIATCVIFVFILFIPESPRWLIANGKIDEAIKVITRAAERNKLETSNIKEEIIKASKDMALNDCETIKTSYLDFCKSKALFLLMLTVFILWLLLGMLFYGIYQYVTIVGFNLYLSVLILGLIQIPIFPLGIIINQRFGRKSSTIGTAIGMATTMLIITFIPKNEWLVNLFGVLASIFSCISFCITYVHLSELYPTPMRNMSYGLASSGAKIGAMVAPFIAILSPRWLPSLCFSLLALICVVCCYFLPETKGQNLKDTMEK